MEGGQFLPPVRPRKLMSYAEKVAQFRKLHQGARILVLANASDAAAARIFEKTGFSALGTSSAGVAFSLGYPDGQRIPQAEMLAAVRRIVRAVSIPVSADVEAGYGDPAATARSLMDAGAVGMNLEDIIGDGLDSLVDIETQVRTIQEIRKFADLVINARTDIYLMGIGDAATRFERAVERAKAYRKAGADCIFIPGVYDAPTIGKLAGAIDAPLNILGTNGTPPVAELEHLGVARVSIGSGPMRAAMGLMERIAKELFDHGTYASMTEGAMSYADANHLFGR